MSNKSTYYPKIKNTSNVYNNENTTSYEITKNKPYLTLKPNQELLEKYEYNHSKIIAECREDITSNYSDEGKILFPIHEEEMFTKLIEKNTELESHQKTLLQQYFTIYRLILNHPDTEKQNILKGIRFNHFINFDKEILEKMVHDYQATHQDLKSIILQLRKEQDHSIPFAIDRTINQQEKIQKMEKIITKFIKFFAKPTLKVFKKFIGKAAEQEEQATFDLIDLLLNMEEVSEIDKNELQILKEQLQENYEMKDSILKLPDRVGTDLEYWEFPKIRSFNSYAGELKDYIFDYFGNKGDGALNKVDDDPRMLKLATILGKMNIGKKMRVLKIDEIPQLEHVGQELSLFGPRTPTDYEIINFQTLSTLLLRMKQGISGPKQVLKQRPSFDEEVLLNIDFVGQKDQIKTRRKLFLQTIEVILYNLKHQEEN